MVGMKIGRRQFLAGSAGMAASVASPRLALSQRARPLTFVPQVDLALLDPHGLAIVTRNHAHMVYDTLFSLDANFQPQLQMLEGYLAEDENRRWTLKLRVGLSFHDGAPVLARDVVASLKRWGRIDNYGKTLFGILDDISAADDKTVVLRLRQSFSHLPSALAKLSVVAPFILPERLAQAEIGKLTEIVGSGPFRFKADEFMSGNRAVYERFAAYRPRENGRPSFLAGPKVVKLDRVEWRFMPDGGTAANALQTGEMDWVEAVTPDLVPYLRSKPGVRLSPVEATGSMTCLYVNHLHPPFDNPRIRRAVLGAIDQTDFMAGAMGEDKSMWNAPAGIFCPGTSLANDEGMATFRGDRDLANARKQLAEAGYDGEKVVLLQVADLPLLTAVGDIAHDLLKRLGMNVDAQSADWATALQRRGKKDAPDKGGWNITPNSAPGAATMDPGVHLWIRGNGRDAITSWPTSPKLEDLRAQWLASSSVDTGKQIAREIQRQCWIDVPYLPTGQALALGAYRDNVRRDVDNMVIFWGVERA